MPKRKVVKISKKILEWLTKAIGGRRENPLALPEPLRSQLLYGDWTVEVETTELRFGSHNPRRCSQEEIERIRQSVGERPISPIPVEELYSELNRPRLSTGQLWNREQFPPIHPPPFRCRVDPVTTPQRPVIVILVLAGTHEDYRHYCLGPSSNELPARFVGYTLNLVHCNRVEDVIGRRSVDTRYVLANRYWELDSELLELVRSRFEAVFEDDAAPITKCGDPVMPFGCIGCKHYFGQTHRGNTLVCAMYPYGPEAETCPDYES